MPTFAYSARSADGRTVQAELAAPSRRDALRILKTRGLVTLNLSEPETGVARVAAAPTARAVREQAAAAAPGGVRLRRKDRLPFLMALHELTSGGLSAGEAVRLLAKRVKEPAMLSLSSGLWERISEGATLSRALAAFPDVFDENTVNLVQAGEATGNLNDVFARVITHLTEQRELQQALMLALAYPIFLTCVAFCVVLFFLFFLLPRLQTLFASLHGEMPFSTRFLIGLADFALHYGIFVVGAAVAGVVAFWRWRHTENGRRTTDGWLIRLPGAGQFFVAQTVLAFSQNLSVLLENGITTAEALRMTEKQVSNRVHRAVFNEATDRVLEGEALAKALTRTGCFPDLVLDQLAVGEDTGNLAPSLRKIAVTFQKKVTSQLNTFTRVIGSAVLMGVFIFVGFIAYAIVQAVFAMSTAIKL